MKRYTIDYRATYDNKDGGWVKYKDVDDLESINDCLRQSNKRLIADFNRLQSDYDDLANRSFTELKSEAVDGDMKRYRINATLCTTKDPSMSGAWLNIYTADDGQWVKHEDVEKLRAEHAEEIKDIVGKSVRASIIFGESVSSIEAVECNCKKMSDNRWSNWLCPVHGYKKL